MRDGTTTPIDATGLPLGLFRESAYDVATFTLHSGDSLLLYTDGLSETENGDGEPYGLCRIERFARGLNGATTDEALTRWLGEVDGFGAAAGRDDDLTLMMIRRDDAIG